MINHESPTPFTFRTAELVAGFLLVTAAFLKFYSPREMATLQVAYELSPTLVTLGIQFELALGVALLTGVWPQYIRPLALVSFLGFAGFSLYRWWGGHESCGCFGSLLIPPWITFGVDAVIFASLLRRWPGGGPRLPVRWAFALYGLMAAPMLFASVNALSLSKSSEVDEVFADGGTIILEPETWVGKPFPLGAHIEPATDFSQGDWTLLFFHHDCPDCQATVPRYDQLAADDPQKQVFLIEVPPFGATAVHLSAAKFGRLTSDKDWFIQAPVEVQIRNGLVHHTSLDLPAIEPPRIKHFTKP